MQFKTTSTTLHVYICTVNCVLQKVHSTPNKIQPCTQLQLTVSVSKLLTCYSLDWSNIELKLADNYAISPLLITITVDNLSSKSNQDDITEYFKKLQDTTNIICIKKLYHQLNRSNYIKHRHIESILVSGNEVHMK